MENCKKKGFVFTVDTIFAIIIALSLATALVSTQQTEKGKEKMFETAAQKARDTAMMEIYVPSNIGDSPSAGAEYYYSISTIKYEIPNETVMPRVPVDVVLVIDVSESMGEQDIYYTTINGQTVSGGTCSSGSACDATNCDSPDTSSMQELGSINIDSDNPLFTIRKDVSTYGAYPGNCAGPKTLIKSPTGIYYDFSNKNNCTTPSVPVPPNTPLEPGDCCYGETGTGECTGTTIESWPKLQTGIWAIYGWADKPTDFGNTDFFITRIDTAKKAAKTFLDNPGWKATDTFGLVGFSCCADTIPHWTTVTCSCCSRQITTCMPLTNNSTIIKAEINKMATVHGTDTDKGIIAASSILSSGVNKKYIVLLTDGRNSCVGSQPYPLCSPTTVCCEAQAAHDVVEATESIRATGITIYAIGFAQASQLQGTTFEDALRQVTKDKDSAYCDDGINCGKYFFAENGTELNNVYQAIASELSSGEIGAQGKIVTIKKIGS